MIFIFFSGATAPFGVRRSQFVGLEITHTHTHTHTYTTHSHTHTHTTLGVTGLDEGSSVEHRDF